MGKEGRREGRKARRRETTHEQLVRLHDDAMRRVVASGAAAAASVQLRAFLLGRSGGGTPQEQRRNLVKAFKAADADRSGTMDRGEFLALLKDAGLRVDVDRATARADVKVVKCPAPRAPVELDHAAVAVLVARRAPLPHGRSETNTTCRCGS